MTTFTLNSEQLRRLCQLNLFPVPDKGMVFMGLRGCLPVEDDDFKFHKTVSLYLMDINYIHPRCTLLQWLPAEEKIATFPGSTVPHIRYIKKAAENNGWGANQLMTGYYEDYRKGVHNAGEDTAHDAFRQTDAHPIRRTADDFDFDNDDRVDFENPYDNIHAAWCMGVNHDNFASAGCQVVLGYPRCRQRRSYPDVGAWKTFKENAYGLSQNKFPYVLLNGTEAMRVAQSGSQKLAVKLRFGSKGDLVMRVQQELQKAGFYEGILDGEFRGRTIRSVLEFQTVAFGPSADDGIIGPITASALGLEWPKI